MSSWSFSLSGKNGDRVALSDEAVNRFYALGRKAFHEKGKGNLPEWRRSMIRDANKATGSDLFLACPGSANGEKREFVSLGILYSLQASIDSYS